MNTKNIQDKSVIWGTHHFRGFVDACDYYSDLRPSEVQKKIDVGEIAIGKPTIKSNEKLYLNREEGRYFIGVK
jgi:hypothetical protein